ncbi:hypothetical protein [Campylobacter magnus]|uniref:hypothetical protein n=1 Tax=Campylobacter magnus TaxID=3026462 RepID=UPI0026DF8CA1|nr:hypothetical protein [Campylobacter magnus]MDO2408387.1 hypothetical protein [Campylobacter magnus]
MCEFLAILSYLLYHLDFETFQNAVALWGLLAYCGLDTLAMVKVLEGLKELINNEKTIV